MLSRLSSSSPSPGFSVFVVLSLLEQPAPISLHAVGKPFQAKLASMGPLLDTVVAADKHGFVLSCVWGFEGFLLPGKLLCGQG